MHGNNLLKTSEQLTVGGVANIIAVLSLLFTMLLPCHTIQVCLKTAMPAHAGALELQYETSRALDMLRIAPIFLRHF
jgi:hypothetical protein